MKPAHRPIAFIVVVFASVMAVVVVSRWTAAEEIVPWRDNFTAAQAEAKASGKPMFVYFTADWCAPCHTLKRTTWANTEVERALRAYVPTRVDVMVNTPIAMKYDAELLPKYVVLNAEGDVVKAADGLLRPVEFLSWLERGARPASGAAKS